MSKSLGPESPGGHGKEIQAFLLPIPIPTPGIKDVKDGVELAKDIAEGIWKGKEALPHREKPLLISVEESFLEDGHHVFKLLINSITHHGLYLEGCRIKGHDTIPILTPHSDAIHGKHARDVSGIFPIYIKSALHFHLELMVAKLKETEYRKKPFFTFEFAYVVAGEPHGVRYFPVPVAVRWKK